MDISDVLSSLTPDDINKLKEVASTLGVGQNIQKEAPQHNDNTISPDLVGLIGKFGNFSSTDDERITLIRSLKPLLSEQRQQRADEAIKILRILQMLPILRESGVLNGLFQGGI